MTTAVGESVGVAAAIDGAVVAVNVRVLVAGAGAVAVAVANTVAGCCEPPPLPPPPPPHAAAEPTRPRTIQRTARWRKQFEPLTPRDIPDRYYWKRTVSSWQKGKIMEGRRHRTRACLCGRGKPLRERVGLRRLEL